MPICIECCYPVPQLYHVLSSKKKAANPSSSGATTQARNSSAPASFSHHQPNAYSGGIVNSASGGGSSGGNNSNNSGGSNNVSGAGAGSGGAGGGGNSGSGGGGGSSGFKGGGEAKKRSSGSGGGADVRLMQCPRCKRFADKYVEHDFVVLFIDLVLVKPQVYRHLLFNRLASGGVATTNTASSGSDDNNTNNNHGRLRLDPAIQRLGVLLVLFDVYLTWSAIETQAPPVIETSPVPRLPILAQYLFYLILCSSTAIAQHLVIRELSQSEWFRGTASVQTNTVSGRGQSHGQSSSNVSVASASGNTQSSPRKGKQKQQSPSTASSPPTLPSRPPSAASGTYPVSGNHGASHAVNGQPPAVSPPPPASRNAVSTAIFVSSCMKLFPILMVVWKYEDGAGQLARGVSWAVAIQNIEALRILLGCSYSAAAILVGLGWAASFIVGQAILAAVGLGTLQFR